jgi:hypothetical protein
MLGLGNIKILVFFISISGSVVECSPATRAARVRFPADAVTFYYYLQGIILIF